MKSAHLPIGNRLSGNKLTRLGMSFLSGIPCVFIVGALGPYLGDSGLKAEHVLIYGIALVYLLLWLPAHDLSPWRGLPVSMPLWICLGFAQAIGYVSTSNVAGEGPATVRILAALEHLAQPLVVVTVIWTLGRTLPSEWLSSALQKALNVVVWGLCLNSLLIAWVIVTGEIGPFAAWLPASAAEPGAVWAAAMQGGRYGGIFNQPFEAGLSYSLALLSWCRLQAERKRIALSEHARLLLLMFGGFVCASKVFLFGGVPLFIVFVLVCKAYRRLITSLLVLVALVFAFQPVLESWTGSSLVMGYFSVEKGTDILDLYTGKRFARDPTQVQGQFSDVWDKSPLFGFGFAPFEIIDSGFLWAFGSGGIIGVGIFVFILFQAVVRTSSLVRRNREQIFPFLILLLMVVAAVGAPAFTINRGSTIFWTLYPLAVLAGLRQNSLLSGERHVLLPGWIAPLRQA